MNFASHITNHTQIYLDRVVDNTNNSIGLCGPLSRIFNATLIATCDKVLLSWVSLFTFEFSIKRCNPSTVSSFNSTLLSTLNKLQNLMTPFEKNLISYVFS